jgi:hypothetical protein
VEEDEGRCGKTGGKRNEKRRTDDVKSKSRDREREMIWQAYLASEGPKGIRGYITYGPRPRFRDAMGNLHF